MGNILGGAGLPCERIDQACIYLRDCAVCGQGEWNIDDTKTPPKPLASLSPCASIRCAIACLPHFREESKLPPYKRWGGLFLVGIS